MLAAADQPEQLPELWGVGEPFEDVDAPLTQVVTAPGRAPRIDLPQAPLRPWEKTRGAVPAIGAAIGAILPIIAGAPPAQAFIWAAIGGLIGWVADIASRRLARRRAAARLSEEDTLLAMGQAVAIGLELDPDQVRVSPDTDGIWRSAYTGTGGTSDLAGDRARFATAMEQVLSPVDWPRYLISRKLPQQQAEIWHAVPDELGRNRSSADRLARAWAERVSDSDVQYTQNPEGAGLLASVRGLNPCDVSAAVRTEWR